MGKGKRRAGPDNERLRQEAKLMEGRLTWYRGRLRVVSDQNKALRQRADRADGLIVTQLSALQSRAARIAELERLLKECGEATVETPMPQLPEAELASTAT